MKPISVLLVDDSPIFLDIARRFLQSQATVAVVGTALSGQEAFEQISRLQPDLVLMDLSMPGLDGLEATRRLKAQPDAPCVVILTLYDNAAYRAQAEAVGADGFIAKWQLGPQLLPTLRCLFGDPAVNGLISPL